MTEFVFTISPRSLSPKFARIEDDCKKLRQSDINEAKRQLWHGYMKWYRRGKYGCILLATLPLQYQRTSPFCDCPVLLLVAIFLSSSSHLPVIFLSSSLSLANITLPILVAIISLPRRYHFAYPCDNYLLLYLIVFYLYWFLCFSLSQLPAQLSLSLHLLVIFLSFSICLVDTTSYILVTIVSSPCWYHFA